MTPERGLSLMSSVETGTTMTLGPAAEPDREAGGADERARPDRADPRASTASSGGSRSSRPGSATSIGRIYREHRVAGFNTYGEQHGGLHVNQTFVGLAFLEPDARNAPAD